jgi:hypothetical protein
MASSHNIVNLELCATSLLSAIYEYLRRCASRNDQNVVQDLTSDVRPAI